MRNSSYPLYNMAMTTDLKNFLHTCVNEYKDAAVFQYDDGKGCQTISYRQFYADVELFASVLLDRGWRNVKIAVIGENSYHWVLTYFAVTTSGNILVPIDKELDTDEILRILEITNCTSLIYSDSFRFVANQASDISTIATSEIPDLLVKGKSLFAAKCEYAENSIDCDNTAVIIYTSGTTGQSKGVMLSHKNITADMTNCCYNVRIEGNSIIALPLHHSFMQIGMLSLMRWRVCSVFLKSIKYLNRELEQTCPTVLFLVPMIVETMYRKIWHEANKKGIENQLRTLIKISNFLYDCGIDIRRILFKRVLSGFGGNLKCIICGGAAIDSKIVKEFRSLGINLITGYGITECSPVVSVNRNNHFRDGSAGLVLRDCEVKIRDCDGSNIGEILVKGDIVMQGYYNDEQATKEAFHGEWFKTGDLGYLDQDGFIYLTGRIKNLIILSNGKNVSPEELENYLLDIREIREVIVYSRNGIITAEIYPNLDIQNAEALINAKINDMNRSLPQFKKIGAVKFRQVEFNKTTTKKIKRHELGGD